MTDSVDDDKLLAEDPEEWIKARPVSIPQWKDPFPLDADYVPEETLISESGQLADYNDMKAVNLEIDKLRIAMYKTAEHLKDAERKAMESKLAYDRQYNRDYLLAEGKTESIKRTIASVKNEKIENRLHTREFVVQELKRRLRLMTVELDALKTIAFNMRKEIESAQ